MLWTVKGIVLGTAACTRRIYTSSQVPPVLTPPASQTSVREHPWDGTGEEWFILQWRDNLIIAGEFLQVPGTTKWTLPGAAGWNTANNGSSEEGKAAQHPQPMFIFSRDEGGTTGQQELCILTGIYWLRSPCWQTDRQVEKASITVTSFLSFFAPEAFTSDTLYTECLYTLFCCGFSSCCWGEWQLPFTLQVLEDGMPGTVRLLVTYCNTSFRAAAKTELWCSVFPLRSGWGCKSGSDAGYEHCVATGGLYEREMYLCALLTLRFHLP